MELIETHAHLDYPDFAGDLEAVVEAARALLDITLVVVEVVELQKK